MLPDFSGNTALLIFISYDVGVKRSFDPYDTGLFRTTCSHNPQNIHNPLIFLRKMAPYSCFGRVSRSKILLQASLHRLSDLLTLVSSYWITGLPVPDTSLRTYRSSYTLRNRSLLRCCPYELHQTDTPLYTEYIRYIQLYIPS